MTVAFLHGVETMELTKGPVPIQQVRTAVIGLVGTAPIHHAETPADIEEPVQVLSSNDNDRFGPDLEGYTIPAALKQLQAQGYGAVVVVNVFDPDTHKTSIAATDLNIVSGAIVTHADLISVVVKAEGGAGSALAEGTDYALDKLTGTITVLADGALAAASKANVAYVHANPAAVAAADIIGEDAGGERTGMQAWLNCASLFGYKPKVLIAPGFSSDAAVASALNVIAQATKLRAVALADAPVGTTRDEAIEGRGTEGEVDLSGSDQRLFYCYPHLKYYDTAAEETKLGALSTYLAGMIAATDGKLGYWHSPSNKTVLGVTGVEVPLTAAVNDPSCDVNRLNAAGIVTVFTGYGLGVRIWGNRSSAFPASAAIGTFMSVRRTIDMVDESIELATLEFQDSPTVDVLVTAILESVNEFIRTLITRGALIDGSRVEYFPADNPASEIAKGHLTFTKTFCPPPPLERLTYKSVLDTSLLTNIFTG